MLSVPFINDISTVHLVFYVILTPGICFLLWQCYFSPVSNIPGPRLAAFGTCFQLWEIYKGRISDTLVQLHRKHGPLLRISYNEVSVSHPSALQILSAPLRKADFYKLLAVPNSNYNNIMSERDPKLYAPMRSNVAPAFTLSNMVKNEPIIDETIELMEQRLDGLCQRNQPVDLGQWLNFLASDLLGEVMFSSCFGFLDQGKDVGGSMNNIFFLSVYVTSMVYMQWLHFILLGNPIFRWLDFQPNEHTYNTAVQCIASRRQHKEPKADTMKHWMRQKKRLPERMSEKDVFCAVVSTLGAGGGTVGSVLGALFYFLLKGDKKFLGRLEQEVDEAVLVGVVLYADTQRLSYLQAVIKETLRLWPGVPWNLPRVVPKEELVVAGHRFVHGLTSSAHTILSVNPWLIHRNQECLGDNAEVYNPERWLGDPATVKQMEGYLIPYGLGYNSCPGRHMAHLELSKITATLIRDFEIRLVNPQKEWKYHQLFVTAQSGWPVWIKRRH